MHGIVSRETMAVGGDHDTCEFGDMFHVKQTTVASLLDIEAKRLGLKAAPDAVRCLDEAVSWHYPAAFRLGLTNYPDVKDYVSQLILPALTLLRGELSRSVHSPLLDFGAGSGAVGLTLALLCPDWQVVLADRRARVVQFLDLACSRLRLSNCRTACVDLSAPPSELQGSIGTVLIRAFGPTGQALEYATPLLQDDGTIALWHQPPSPPPPDDFGQAITLETSVSSLALTLYSRHA
jgi:hypothetical protein